MGGKRRTKRAAVLTLLTYGLTSVSSLSYAGGPIVPGLKGTGITVPAPPSNATPVPRGVGLPVPPGVFPGVSSIEKPTDNSLVIHQDQPKAIIDWASFDIGKNASTHFDQQGNSHWTALNRIWDQNPSRIFGKLTADGKVYLINQNGILFGPDSKVNVHTLVASSLNLRDEDFLANRLKLKAENYQQPGEPANASALIANEGAIQTAKAGAVFLVAPRVENTGSIVSPVGQIGLAAGTEVEIAPDTNVNTTRSALVVNVKDGAGEVSNREGGQLLAETGLVGLYGRLVNQEGLARATSSVKKRGRIEIFASEKITTGPNSVTEAPVSDSKERVHQSFEFQGGEILLQGLDPSRPLAPQTPVSRIEHRGVIHAPGGSVRLDADERVYLEEGSLIDVSGLWVVRQADAQFLTAQLNSVEMRDQYGQKNGILRGKTIQVSGLLGSSIGDLSGYLKSQELTAAEQAVRGGQISISATSGDIILKHGASLDFSGGGYHYEGGHLDTTYLLSGRKVYHISNAPQWLIYDTILNEQFKVHERFAIRETYEGLYFGGAAPVRDLAAGHVEGHDAGTLMLMARTLALDGRLDGSVVRGPFQTLPAEPVDSLGLQTARGRMEPKAGTLVIGRRPLALASPETQDFLTEAVVVQGKAMSLPKGFGPDDLLPAAQGEGVLGFPVTSLSAQVINAAGLGGLEIYANTVVRTETDASLALAPAGSVTLAARRIEHFGSIRVPGGAISLSLRDNVTSFDQVWGEQNPRYIPLQSRVFLGSGSLLDASGERIDNSASGGAGTPRPSHTAGGTITLDVGTFAGEGVILARGSTVDVSGGWEIDTKGKVKGAAAGTLSVAGPSLVLDGKMAGYAITGSLGGKVILHAANVSVEKEARSLPIGFDHEQELPEAFRNNLILAQDRLDSTGFSRVELVSVNDLRLEPGITLSPSSTRMTEPAPAGLAGVLAPNLPKGRGGNNGGRLTSVTPDEAGNTSVVLRAGRELGGGPSLNKQAVVSLGQGAQVKVAPGGEISLEGPGVDVGGVLEAPAGRVALMATLNDLILREGGGILARGYLRSSGQSPAAGTEPQLTPLPGGSVLLSAANGDITLEAGSMVDVSGSATTLRIQSNVDGTLSNRWIAGDPGGIELSFLGSLALEGELLGRGRLEGLRGGSLTIRRTSTAEGLIVDASDVARYQEMGFDALTFASWCSLEFPDTTDLHVGRSLTLDAPEIRASGEQRISLSAPWVRLTNSYYPGSGTLAYGGARLDVTGDFVDVEGNVRFSGFSEMSLNAQEDIRLSDRFYRLGQVNRWSGLLETTGNLTMAAKRIYPTTLSEVTVRSGGRITTLPGDQGPSPPVFSAGGRLTLEAPGIDHRGYLAAPMGQISLTATGPEGRVFLAEGSILTTEGQASVNYGTLDDVFWTTQDKRTLLPVDVSAAPEGRISLSGAEVIAREGATIDASAGGSIFAFQFQPGIEGSVNPLKIKGRYVIVPDGSIKLPGEAVYLSGVPGVPSGVYSLLPPEYAFLPGAIVIQDLGVPTSNMPGRSPEGYPVTTGYFTIMGTELGAQNVRCFSVRSARSVLREGHFNMRRIDAGDGGTVSVQGQTTILNASISASGLDGYRGGILALSGRDLVVGANAASLPQEFDFSSPVPDELRGRLLLDASGLSGRGFEELRLGDLSLTDNLTVAAGTVLEFPTITLAARNAINLESGAEIRALGQGGVATFLAPTGAVSMAPGSMVQASHAISLDMRSLDLQGSIELDGGELRLSSDRIFVVPGSYSGGTADGLYITEPLWQTFGGIDNVRLNGRLDMTFLGLVGLSARQCLTIDTPRIAGVALNGDPSVTLAAPEVRILNTGASSTNSALSDSGTLAVSAQQLFVGHGGLLTDGFSRINLTARDDLIFLGAGSLLSSGDLTLTAARITTSYYTDGATPYEVARFLVNAGDGRLAITPGAGTAGTSSTPGGGLEFVARTVDLSGTIEVSSGQVILRAMGSGPNDSVLVRGGGRILARGSDLAPGGTISLSATGGAVAVQGGALLDVSAGSQGDAGWIELRAPVGGVNLATAVPHGSRPEGHGEGQGRVVPHVPVPGGSAVLSGAARGGRGGSFLLDTARLSSFSALNATLAAGGFNDAVDIRVRNGDLFLTATDMVTARDFRLTADQGAIGVRGTIDATGQGQGGRVSLFAGSDLTIHSGAAIRATGTAPGAPGGEVLLGSTAGSINLEPGGRIDVSGGQEGTGGRVTLRAQRQANDLLVNLNGTIAGASGVFAEAVRTYHDTNITSSDLTTWRNDTQAFMNNAGNIEARLLSGLVREGWESSQLHLLPAIEIRSSGDLILASNWDLTNWRFGGEPGTVTLRAAGNLNINADLVDHPTGLNSLPGSSGRDSWGITLVAGADLTGADPMAVSLGSGDLRIADGKMVYSESAPLWFASGRDTLIGPGSRDGYMIRSAIRYSLGTYDAEIVGRVGRDLIIRGGAIQSATGDISIDVGRDVVLQIAQDFGASTSFTSLGSIRTTGQGTTGIGNFWDYAGGGDILLRVGGSVAGALATNAWDFAYGTRPPRRWAASFENHNATEGLATMGGGSLTVYAGGGFFTQAGTFGVGDLTIFSGGDLNGRFLVKAGEAQLRSMGNFGTGLPNNAVEAFDARIDISAQGNIALGTVVNPTIARDGFVGSWNLGYTPSSSVSLISVTGDVSISGDSAFYPLGASVSNLERILPANLEIRAGRDIRLSNDFALAPSATGRLCMTAGGSIDGQYLFSMNNQTSLRRASINMSDVDPATVYGERGRTVTASLLFSRYAHAPYLLHLNDPYPVEIRAAGDIRNLSLYLPKRAEITAGRDIRDIYYFGQNVSGEDISLIRAGRHILFSSSSGSNFQTGMEHAGPGFLMVQAGGNIDLGTTRGIITTGNANNAALGTQGSTLMVIAGYDKLWTPSQVETFFNQLQDAGKEYSQLLAEGDRDGADAVVTGIRQTILAPFFEGATRGEGRIEMVRSQISTASGGDIFAIAAGAMNVGVSTLTTEAERENTGINTMSGGAIRLFSMGDVNVNESRVMTFLGGDIVIWSDSGDVNAGRGSKTAVNTSRPVRVNVGSADNPIWVLQRRPVAVGSGVRTLTYDPDGLEGPVEPPLAGDVYIFAPEGIIDAGEAGISGRNVFLGATAIVNAQNITFSVGSIGVPVSVDSGPGLGVLTGATGLSETSRALVEQTAAVSTGEKTLSKEEAAKLAESMMAKWVRVEFIGFEDSKGGDDQDEEHRKRRQ